MDLPFSRAEFFQVFADYNQAIWPIQLLATLLGVVVVALVFLPHRWADRLISLVLCVLWAFTGLGYHWAFFSSINPAAWFFGALFLTAGAVFGWEGVVRARLRYQPGPGVRTWLAMLVILYALAIYPLVGLLVTHPYPQTPLFGVVPCPTTIFTLGLLMLAAHPKPLLVAAIPLAWALLGGSAALVLDVPQDWGLLVAAALWAASYLGGGRSRRAG